MRYALILSILAAGCSSDKAVSVYNTSPTATILDPVESAQFHSDETISFVGQVDDRETNPEELLVSWATDVEGLLTEDSIADADGRVTHNTTALTPGEHVVTLRVIDDKGKSGDNSIAIFVINADDPPTMSIRHPAPDGSEKGEEGVPFDFEVIVGDPQDAATDLIVTINRIAEDGSVAERLCVALPESDGVASCAAELDEGTYSLSFEVEDTDANITEQSLVYVVESGLNIDNDLDGYTENEGDCDDLDYDTNPDAFESLNGVDDDCNGLIDDTTTAYDDDGDGFSEDAGDCDDDDATIYPYASEWCDGIDNDCNGTVDGTDALDALIWYADVDRDGFGDASSIVTDCEAPDGYTDDSSDCDDTDDDSYPGGTEVCDSADNDCNGIIDEEGAVGCSTYYRDFDDDGYGSTLSVCACAPIGHYTSGFNNDCYDSNAEVNVAHATHHTNHRGDGSYDYNCNGIEEKENETMKSDCSGFIGFSCSGTEGWDGSSPPACGETRNWRYNCDRDGLFSCSWDDSEARTQACL